MMNFNQQETFAMFSDMTCTQKRPFLSSVTYETHPLSHSGNE